jgi:3-oxoadipate enol-lactonase
VAGGREIDLVRTQGFAEVNGARLFYDVTEGPYDDPSEGPSGNRGRATSRVPVVFVHGFTLDTRMWDAQVAPFGERYPVVRYDARGFGRSSLPDEQVEYAHEDDLRALLDHLGIAKAHVVGLSMGGGIVTNFALAYPERTVSLVLVDAGLDGHTSRQRSTPAAPMPETPTPPRTGDVAKAKSVAAAREVWLQSPLFAPANQQPEVAVQLRAIVEDYSGWHWLHKPKQRVWDPTPAARLGEIKIPTLVILGDRDTPRSIEMSEALAAGISGARLVVLRGIGHMANMEAPAEFNEIVLKFLAEVEGRG